MVAHTVWIRAGDIQVLAASEFTIVPILSILLRMLGEVYACISLAAGVAGGVAVVFGAYLGRQITGSIPGSGLPQSLLFDLLGGGGSTFISAVLLVLGGALAAVFWLLLFYLASEMLAAVIDIARNTRVLRRIVERQTQTGSNQ